MPIKPESITKEQAERFAELMDADFGRFLNDYAAIPIEKIANALIEAGIVSPPVWVIKKDAAIVSGCFSSHKNAVAYRDSLYEPVALKVEHWKGKTE
jgi:hypothetical protein